MFKIAFVAICHQINWDFLQQRLADHLLTLDLEAMIDKLAGVRADELRVWLRGYAKPHRVQASDRAAMLRSVGRVVTAELAGDPLALVRESGGMLEGASGFVRQLDRFEPYRLDPLKKKAYVLVQDLIRERIVAFHDADKLRPAVDYHIMRLYLRSGRVVPVHQVVFEILKGQRKPRPRLVRLLREAVSEAIVLTAHYARMSVADVNYVEWQLGRAVCEPKDPACLTGRRSNSLDPDVSRLFSGGCPFTEFCEAFRNPVWRKLREPKHRTNFY